jgi:hypothetical protein
MEQQERGGGGGRGSTPGGALTAVLAPAGARARALVHCVRSCCRLRFLIRRRHSASCLYTPAKHVVKPF